MSFKVEVIADNSGKFCGNTRRFARLEEACSYAADLAERWTLVSAWRVVETMLEGERVVCFKYFSALVIALCLSQAAQAVAVVSFDASTAEEATAIGSSYTGREAFQLQGATRGSMLYSDPFAITTWGESRPTPGAWEHRSGLMQTIPQRDFPADWFDIEPRWDGLFILHQWHILEGDGGDGSNYAHSYPWYITGLDWLEGLKIQRDTFFLYRWRTGTPATYQIYYGSSAGNVPEPDTLVGIVVALFVVLSARRCRRQNAEITATYHGEDDCRRVINNHNFQPRPPWP